MTDHFDLDAQSWWSGNSHLELLRCLNPARLSYLRNIFTEKPGRKLSGVTVLDIGCGGGFLSEELARQGCCVTGIDPSKRSIEIAQLHAEQRGLAIKYQVACGESLPFQSNSFDVVCCCDVLEHVADLKMVIRESARVLQPEGVYFYDTINRTWLSKFTMITLMQKWEWVRVIPPDLHDWNKFIKPSELTDIMVHYGLIPQDRIGLHPKMDPAANIKRLFVLRKVKKGEIRYSQLAEGMVFRAGRCQLMNYMGYSIKNVGI